MSADLNPRTTGSSFLLRVHGPAVNQDFPLPEGVTRIGRTGNAEIVIGDLLLSGAHARFERRSDRCWVEDLDSGNGTAVNGIRLAAHQPFALVSGDRVSLGEHTIELLAAPERSLAAIPPESALEETTAMQAETDEGATAATGDRLGLTLAALESPALAPAADEPAADEPVELSVTAATSLVAAPAGRFVPALAPRGGDPLESVLPPTSIRFIHYLPELYTRDAPADSFLARYLAVFESIYLPLEWTVANFDLFLSLETAPEPFLPWWDRWFNLVESGPVQDNLQPAVHRSLLAEAWALLGHRGTRAGLARALELHTGYTPEIVDQASDLPPHTFRVHAVLGQGATAVSVAALIDAFKPAHTVCQLTCEMLP